MFSLFRVQFQELIQRTATAINNHNGTLIKRRSTYCTVGMCQMMGYVYYFGFISFGKYSFSFISISFRNLEVSTLYYKRNIFKSYAFGIKTVLNSLSIIATIMFYTG